MLQVTVCVCVYVCVYCVCVWACLVCVLVSRQRSSSSICTPATPAKASERPFLFLLLTCLALGIWARFLQVQLLLPARLNEFYCESTNIICNQFLSKTESIHTCPITHISAGAQLIKLGRKIVGPKRRKLKFTYVHIHARSHTQVGLPKPNSNFSIYRCAPGT